MSAMSVAALVLSLCSLAVSMSVWFWYAFNGEAPESDAKAVLLALLVSLAPVGSTLAVAFCWSFALQGHL